MLIEVLVFFLQQSFQNGVFFSSGLKKRMWLMKQMVLYFVCRSGCCASLFLMPTGVYGTVAGAGTGHSVGRQGFLCVVRVLMGEWGEGGGMQKLALREEVDRVACAGSSRVRIGVGLRKMLVCFSKVYFDYWVVEAELLTPLTFVWHC